MVQISATHTAKYSKAHNRHTKDVLKLVKLAMPHLLAEFDVPENAIDVIVRPIKAKHTRGQARSHDNGTFDVEVDCRLIPTARLLDTLAHEFTHVEQYHQGRLSHSWGGNQWLRSWVENGTTTTFNTARTHQSYLNRPWEVEARRRGAEFAQKFAHLVEMLND